MPFQTRDGGTFCILTCLGSVHSVHLPLLQTATIRTELLEMLFIELNLVASLLLVTFVQRDGLFGRLGQFPVVSLKTEGLHWVGFTSCFCSICPAQLPQGQYSSTT